MGLEERRLREAGELAQRQTADEFGFGRTSKLLEFSGELAMPEDLADAILFLASDQSRYVNGEELKCDGGWTCF